MESTIIEKTAPRIIADILVTIGDGQQIAHGTYGVLYCEGNSPKSLNFRPATKDVEFDVPIRIDFDHNTEIELANVEFYFTRWEGDVAFFSTTLQESSSREADPLRGDEYSLLPGTESLGFGVPVGGEYSVRSVTNRIYDFRYQEAVVVTFDGKKWLLPKGLSCTSLGAKSEGRAQYFSSRSKVTEHFNVKGGIQGSYGGFNAEFSAQYTDKNERSEDFSYSIYDYEVHSGYVNVDDVTNSSYLAEGIKKNARFLNLPDKFTPANATEWFAFFQLYGTQFISKIFLGGKLYYYAALANNYNRSENEIKTDTKISYENLFFKTSAEVHTEKSKVSETWSTKAETRATVHGGTTGINVDTHIDCEKANYKAQFDAWRESIPNNYYAASFQVASISNIFSGSKQTECQKAITAYTNLQLLISATWNENRPDQTLPSIQLCGSTIPVKTARIDITSVYNTPGTANPQNPVIKVNDQLIEYKNPTEKPDSFRSSYWFVVVNPDTLAIEKNIAFQATGDRDYFKNTILPQLHPLMNGRNILAFATKNLTGFDVPQGDFHRFLKSCGAGTQYDYMERHKGDTMAGATVYWNYELVGVMGGDAPSTRDKSEGQKGTFKGTFTSNMAPNFCNAYIPVDNNVYENNLQTFRAVVVNLKGTPSVKADITWSGAIQARNKRYFEDRILPLLAPFKNREHLLIFTTYNMNFSYIPQGRLYDFLRDCGGGSQLAVMERHRGDTTSGLGSWNYSLVGVMESAANSGMEHAERFATGTAKVSELQPIVLIPASDNPDPSQVLYKPCYC